ncbi:unnamed protein product [Lasius platythorax]
MANSAETTFEDFEINERFKKQERSLKLAVLRKAHNNSVYNREMLPAATNWPSISSINVDSVNSSCVTPSMQTSVVKSEVLASSNNLRNLTKRNYKIDREIMATSSIKQDDQRVMPPPMRNIVYRTSKETQGKVLTLPNYETVVSNSLNRSVQSSTVNTFSLSGASCISANPNASKECQHSFVAPMTPTNDPQKVNRIFSRWRVMLNDHCELIIKGTLECGRIAHSKPVIRRYTATCVESKYKHKYNLQGNIVDERNVLPDYIRGKFYNGFPDDWENVYQIWRTYVSQGCPVTFRWPTSITDSDDDLKSELTELTYIHTRNSKTIPMETYESIRYTKSENPSDKSPKKKEIYHNCSTHSQSYENTSFVKPLTSNFEKDIIPVVQTRNIKLVRDKDNKQNTELDVSPVYSSRGMNKLKDIIYEDKLNIIINNLMDRNCSPKYIKKIIEMFDCLDYVVSYEPKSECNCDSVVSASPGTSSKLETIPQPNLVCSDNCINTNKSMNEITEQRKNYMHSDLRYGSIKIDPNSTRLSNPINLKPEHDDNDSDKSESEIYAGIPKISIERILQARKASRKVFKHKVRKKPVNSQCNAKGIEYEFESAHETIPIANNKKSLLSDKPCICTEDEVKMINTRKCHETINIAQRSRKDTFCSHPEMQRNNCDVYDANKPAMQNKQLCNAFEAQRDRLNVFIKEQKVPHGVQENAMRSQFVTDIDYITDSDIDVIVSTNTQKTDRNMIASHSNLDQNIVISSDNNSNFEKPFVFRESHREFIEQPKNEITTKKSKPSIISFMPVNLKLKIKKADSKSEQLQASDVSIVENEEDKQYSNIQPLEEVHKKKSVSKTPIATTKATIANDFHSKMTVDNKKKIYLTTNKKNESHTNPTNLTKPMTNPTIEQSKSNELEIENNPKVLSAWMPKVMYYAKSKSELGLTFEGKLLNEFGHVVHRKFETDIVLKRLSATLIETVNHELYKLLGCLNDNKHVIPKELAKQCRNGCPANIEQFCLTWKMLQNNEIQKKKEKLYDTSMDSLNTSVSSRGRRIVPPLSYWTGERITLKDNNLVYNPGSSQESSLISLIETSKEVLNTEETRKQKVNYKNTSKEQKLLSKSNETPGTNKNQTIVIEKTQSSNKSPKTKSTNSTKRVYKSNKSRKSQINDKRHIKQNSTFSSTDSSEEEQNIPPSKRTRLNTNTEAPSQYTMTLRKRQKVEASPNEVSCRNTTKLQ